jgi:hypothetical protein
MISKRLGRKRPGAKERPDGWVADVTVGAGTDSERGRERGKVGRVTRRRETAKDGEGEGGSKGKVVMMCTSKPEKGTQEGEQRRQNQRRGG